MKWASLGVEFHEYCVPKIIKNGCFYGVIHKIKYERFLRHGVEQAVSRTRYAPVASATGALICLVTLTFDLLTLKLVCISVHEVGDHPTNFSLSGTFRSRLMDQQCSES